MNDRYLYKGKIKGNLTGHEELDWVIGKLIVEQSTGRHFIIDLSHFDENTKLCDVVIEVDPSTICQCTGLKDQNEALFVTDRKYQNECGIAEERRMSKQAYEKLTKRICRAAGITDKDCTVHVFRKTFATRLSDRGCPLEIIQELLGHADAGTTSKHYIATSRKKIKREYENYAVAA